MMRALNKLAAGLGWLLIASWLMGAARIIDFRISITPAAMDESKGDAP